MYILFIILSIAISLAIFLFKEKRITTMLSVLFLGSLVYISSYAYLHCNKTENAFFTFDSLGVLLAFVLSLLSIATFYFSKNYLQKYEYNAKSVSIYYSALIMMITALLSAYFSNNIAILWVSIEASSFFVSILVFYERSKLALEASWKYLFVATIGIAVAFVGILLLSIAASNNGLTNLNFATLREVTGNINPLWLKISILLIITGFSVKLSVFPLYAVAIDAKTVAPSPINALMSTVLVNAGFIAIFRTFTVIAHTNILTWTQNVLFIVGLFSIFIVAIQLLRVKRLKRAFAFSTMEHMGIVCIGLAVGGIGYYAVILHIVLHSFVKTGLFYQINRIHTTYKSKWIEDFSGYFTINPFGGIALLVGLISVTAIPPSGLFVSEFLVFKALFLGHRYIIAVIALILLTVIMYILGKIILSVLYGKVPENIEISKPNYLEHIIQLSFFGLVIYLGINPPVFFINLINNAISILN